MTASTSATPKPSIDERRAEVQAKLEAELKRIIDSGEYAAWFAKMAAFHRYSPTNIAWILAQAPAATKVASYRTWQQIGRQVRRGETGIMVFHPKPYWVDPTTGDRVRPPRTASERARFEQHVGFGVGHVFDVAQTDGEPLPELGRPAPADAPRALTEHLDGWCVEQGVAVETRDLPTGLYGYYQRDGDRIVLASSNTAGERVATLAHELAHRQDPELVRAEVVGDRRYYAHNRADCEAVAEAAAHAVSARFNHDLTGHSAGYIASWVKGDVSRLTELQQRVGKATSTLLPPDQLDLALDAARQQAATTRTAGRAAGRSGS
jgi:antirestriction protein ArdC